MLDGILELVREIYPCLAGSNCPTWYTDVDPELKLLNWLHTSITSIDCIDSAACLFSSILICFSTCLLILFMWYLMKHFFFKKSIQIQESDSNSDSYRDSESLVADILWQWVTPEYFLLLCIGALLVYGTVMHTHSTVVTHKMHVLTVVALIGATVLAWPSFDAYSATVEPVLGCAWSHDRHMHDCLIECFMLVASIITICAAYRFNKASGILSFEYYILIQICVFSFCMFVHADNLITMYVLVELQSICSYILTAMSRYSRYSIEAGLKYFVLGSFSSVVLLFGISFTYGFAGLVNLSDPSLYVRYTCNDPDRMYTYATLLSLMLINVGFLFKIYASPFHFRVGDIYQGAPTSVTMFLATVPITGYVYVFIKLYVCAFSELATFYTTMLYIFAIMSMLFGVLGALIQRRLKRLLAYSTVSTIGFVLAGISCNNVVMVQQCIQYMFIYVVNVIPIFIIMLSYRVNDSDCLDDIRQLSSIYAQNKYVFALVCVSLFSLAGIPPFSGFVAKLELLTSLGHEHKHSLVVTGMLATVLSCYYYIRIAKMVLYDGKVFSYFYARPTYAAIFSATCLSVINVAFLIISPWVDSVFEYIAIRLYI